MKKLIYSMLFVCLIFCSCVQKTYDRKVRFIVDVSSLENIESVGLRGSSSPLSWNSDTLMYPIVKDSLYQLDMTFQTGFLGAEVKFTVNGEFELQNKDNRRFAFDLSKDTTVYYALFDKE